jgi:hypothetical protein
MPPATVDRVSAAAVIDMIIAGAAGDDVIA